MRGWIDLNGAPGGWTVDDVSVDHVIAYVDALDLGGGVHPIRYETAWGDPWVYYLLEPAAMRAWLRHPEFHLAK